MILKGPETTHRRHFKSGGRRRSFASSLLSPAPLPHTQHAHKREQSTTKTNQAHSTHNNVTTGGGSKFKALEPRRSKLHKTPRRAAAAAARHLFFHTRKKNKKNAHHTAPFSLWPRTKQNACFLSSLFVCMMIKSDQLLLLLLPPALKKRSSRRRALARPLLCLLSSIFLSPWPFGILPLLICFLPSFCFKMSAPTTNA